MIPLLQRAAERAERSLDLISLGVGQGARAAAAVGDGVRDGKWVVLQNLHLLPGWMGNLAQIVVTLAEGHADPVHEGFRLVVTSRPWGGFPQAILHHARRVVVEEPRGVKASLLAARESIDSPVKYSLALFHALLNQRTRYGSLGFNHARVFSGHELAAALRSADHTPAALRYLVGDVLYAGLLSDAQDAQVVRTTLDYALASTDSRYTPPAWSGALPLDFVLSLPDHDPPEVLGFHASADLAAREEEGRRLLELIRCTCGSAAPEAAPALEELEQRLLPVAVPPPSSDALATFLRHEAALYGRLVVVVREGLEAVRRRSSGEENADDLADELARNTVPAAWRRWSFASEKPLLAWTDSLRERVLYLNRWAASSAPKVHLLPLYFYPQGFLTALLQQAARSTAAPVDTLHFEYGVGEGAEGTLVGGLHTEGARWDPHTKLLEDCRLGELLSALPPVGFAPTREPRARGSHPLFPCPVYRTRGRRGAQATTGASSNLVTHIELPGIDVAFWIRRGCAILCEA